MFSINKRCFVFLTLISSAGLTSQLHAAFFFHLMQIEQVIGGIEGDTTAQAIQLRMRNPGQHFVTGQRLVAYDGNGLNPVVIHSFLSDASATSVAGSRILLATSSFATHVNPSFTSDFELDNAIPDSYLEAGSLTFENSIGTVWWRLSWGGTRYTGSNAGSITNDADGNFAPPWPGSLPSTGIDALQFLGTHVAPSTTNTDDYSLTPAGAVFTNNAGASWTVQSSGGPCPADCSNGDNTVNVTDLLALLAVWGQVDSACELAGSNTLNVTDLLAILAAWGPCP